MRKIKVWEVKDTTGVFTKIEADQLIIDNETKLIHFYSKGEVIAIYPITHIVRMGVIDGRIEGGDTDEITK